MNKSIFKQSALFLAFMTMVNTGILTKADMNRPHDKNPENSPFNMADTDKNGSLNSTEYMNFQKNMEEKMKKHQKEIFTKLDKNSDKMLSEDEFMNHMPPKMKEKISFAEVDANADGMITHEEMKEKKHDMMKEKMQQRKEQRKTSK